MPIYEYQCDKCGISVELLQKISEKPLEVCEKCSGKMGRIISQSSFHLKGGGWYVTDYAGSSRPGTSAPSSMGSDSSSGSSSSE